MTAVSRVLLSCALAILLGGQLSQAESAVTRTEAIPAQPLSSALNDFAQRTGLQLIYVSDLAQGVHSKGAPADLSAEETLQELLRDTGLSYEFLNNRTVAIRSIGNNSRDAGTAETRALINGTGAAMLQSTVSHDASRPGWLERFRLAQADTTTSDEKRQDTKTSLSESQELPAPEETGKAIPEILVKGSFSLNTDIRRTEDDIQPYVVFDREQIERSSAANLEDFLKTNMPMNAANRTLHQTADSPNVYYGGINLRGLGINQTLILVDGRRIPSATTLGSDLNQPDISGIPLSSIERIEVLPSTASAIYGGSATGGVINIIRKRGYSGFEIQARYGNTFSGDAGSIQLSVAGGVGFENGRSHLTFNATHAEADALLVAERDFGRRSRALLMANNPELIVNRSLPPTGSTTNVCAATDFFGIFQFCDGSPLVLDSGAPLGASIAHVPYGYAGPGSDNGAMLASNGSGYNLDIPDDQQYLLRTPTKDAMALGLRHEIGSSVDVYIDLSADRAIDDLSSDTQIASRFFLPAGATNNPFQQDVLVVAPPHGLRFSGQSERETSQIVGGAVVRLPREWAATLEQNWSRTQFSSEGTRGLLDSVLSAEGISLLGERVLQDLNSFPLDLGPYVLPTPNYFTGPFDTTLRATNLRVSGPAMHTPAGKLMLTGMVERRKEEAEEGIEEDLSGYPLSGLPVILYPPRSQEVTSYYLEALLPVFSSTRPARFGHDLEIQASVRHDDYETISTADAPQATTRDGPFAPAEYFTNKVRSTDYLIGLRYAPIRDLALRTSFGTGFVPPGLGYITPRVSMATLPTPSPFFNPPDPRRGNTPLSVPRVQITGGNPDLKPEESESWSAGLIFTPRFLEQMRLSVDYTQIKKSDEIFIGNARFILQNESSFPGRVVRGANLPGDQPGWAGPVTQIDMSALNLSATRVESYDFQLDYEWQTSRVGTLRLATVATRMEHLDRKPTQASPTFDSVGYIDGPLQWRAYASLGWERGSWTASWDTQYFDDYKITFANPSLASLNPTNVLNQGSTSIPSQIYHDLWVRFRFDTSVNSLLADMIVSFGVQNVLDSDPPIIAADDADSFGSGYSYSSYGDPRLRRYMLSIQKSF